MDLVHSSVREYDKSVGRLFAIYLAIEACNKILKTASNIPFLSSNSTYLLGVIYILFLAKEWKYVSKVFQRLVFMEVFFIVLVLISFLRYPDYGDSIMKSCLWTVTFCIPFLCLGIKVTDKWLFLDQTKYASYFVTICMLYITIMQRLSSVRVEYDMALGYMLLYPILYHTCKIKENKCYILLVMTEFVLIFMYGSRGPILCYGVFIVLFLFFKDYKNKSKKTVFFRVITLSVIVVLIVSGYFFINDILAIINDMGGASRTLKSIMQGDFFKHGSRSALWLETCEHIQEKPIIGWGVAGYLSCMEQYPHLVFLEILLDYGIIFGSAICLFVLVHVISALKTTRYSDNSLLILFACGLCPLLLSSTYLQEPMFWLLIGLCVSTNRRHIHVRWNKRYEKCIR